MNDHPILVGYDRSLFANSALAWAQREAAVTGAPVRLVYVDEWSSSAELAPAEAAWPNPAVRREAAAAVAEAATAARESWPGVAVRGIVLDGVVISALRALSAQARLLVVGHRGLGGFAGLQAGSVAVGMASYARCPVVVVRGTAASHLPVVVGVDSSPDSDQAIGFAFDEAARRGVPVLAIRAWPPPPVPHRANRFGPPYDSAAFARLETAQGQLARELIADWQDKYPQVPSRVHLVTSGAADALVAASTDAQLVVVGARGRGGFAGQPLGAVAHQLVHHARCPVAIVRDHTEPV